MFEITDEHLTGAGIFVGSVVAAVANALLPKGTWASWIKKLRPARGVPGTVEITRDREVYRLLAELRFEFDADRAHVWRFHNGTHFAPGKGDSIWKMTVTHEIVALGVSREASNCKGILFSHLTGFAGPVLTGESSDGAVNLCHECKHCPAGSPRHCVFTIVDMMENSSAKQMLVERGVYATLSRNLSKHGKDRDFGILTLEWCAPPTEDPQAVHKHRALCQAAERVQYLLGGA
jgi:hypothetical protein